MKAISALALGALALGLASSPPASAQTPQTLPSVEQQLAEARAADSGGDRSTAVRIWSLLALENVVEAQYHVGMDLSNCHNDLMAAAWLLKAANQDHTGAEAALGRLYTMSSAFQNTPDHAGAGEAWLETAAAKGNAEAQYWLGEINSHGNVSPEQSSKAVAWYEKAAAQGRIDAAVDLGRLYGSGQGVAKDPVKAAYWNGKAAEANDGHAQFELARAFETGQGVGRDYVRAYKWYALAATSGQTWGDSDGAMARIAAKMTHGQIAHARAQVDAFRKVYPARDLLPPPIPVATQCPAYPNPTT